MEKIYDKCCGIDVHKKLIVACLRSGRKNLKALQTFMTKEQKARVEKAFRQKDSPS